jgi:hypothetical protein
MLVGLLAGGCSPPWADDAPPVEIPPMPGGEQTNTEQAAVDIYWDATFSMQGYTTIQEQNAYRSLPDNLEDIGTSIGETKFFAFGENIKPLEGRSHRQFMESSFYGEVITAIHNVVQNANLDHLSIVVTDLFESDADWSILAKQIKDKYFAAHRSVAIIGVKNPFAGDIFDVGYKDHSKIYYDSGADKNKFRPFYMVLMGPDKDVRTFIARWKARSASPANEMQYLLLTENLVDNVPSLSNMNIVQSDNFYPDQSVDLSDSRMTEYGINSKSDLAALEARFVVQPSDDVCKINAFNTRARVLALEDGEWKEQPSGKEIKMELNQSDENSSEYAWKLSFYAARALKPDSINLVEAVVTPSRDGFELPDWVNAWSMNTNDSQMQFDGSKTINFQKFASSLKDSAMDAMRPSVANIFMLIKN